MGLPRCVVPVVRGVDGEVALWEQAMFQGRPYVWLVDHRYSLHMVDPIVIFDDEDGSNTLDDGEIIAGPYATLQEALVNYVVLARIQCPDGVL